MRASLGWPPTCGRCTTRRERHRWPPPAAPRQGTLTCATNQSFSKCRKLHTHEPHRSPKIDDSVPPGQHLGGRARTKIPESPHTEPHKSHKSSQEATEWEPKGIKLVASRQREDEEERREILKQSSQVKVVDLTRCEEANQSAKPRPRARQAGRRPFKRTRRKGPQGESKSQVEHSPRTHKLFPLRIAQFLFVFSLAFALTNHNHLVRASPRASSGGGLVIEPPRRPWAFAIDLAPGPLVLEPERMGDERAAPGHRWQRRSLLAAEDSPRAEPSAAQQDAPMPYKTYYVTQACEWKSNLFVPKSNDIHFAQPVGAAGGARGGEQIAAPQAQVQQQSQQQQQQQQTQQRQLEVTAQEGASAARTILSTSSKALVLALPISHPATFAGYEPACSIRLFVPANMRILAKLTARRLTFDAEQVPPGPRGPSGDPAELGASPRGQFWLNVSQNQFSETEQKVFETEGNVLAFRFLLERFAGLQARDGPEPIRFQVVLTAFQTLGENSDFNQPTGTATTTTNGQASGPNSPPPLQQQSQFICDSQRLISANLACDGFKNCQDGHDEEPNTCALLRQQQQQNSISGGPPPVVAGDGGGRSSGGKNLAASNQRAPPATGQRPSGGVLDELTRATSPLVGLLLGLLLLVLLLICCTCTCYCLLLLVRRATTSSAAASESDEAGGSSSRRAQRRLAALKLLAGEERKLRDGRELADEGLETDSLAREQNLENAVRLKARGLLDQAGASTSHFHQQGRSQQQPLVAGQVRQIQSILKRPMRAGGAGGQAPQRYAAPLARFESIPGGGGAALDPPPPPPRGSQVAQQQQRPQASQVSPRRGALADELSSARALGRTLPNFRPMPAARGQQRRPLVGPAAVQTGAPEAPQQQQQQLGLPQPLAGTSSPREQQSGSTTASDRFAFKSKTTKVEQTSTSTGSERVTVYQYSTNLAQYSESYLLKQARAQTSSPMVGQQLARATEPRASPQLTTTRVAPPAAGQTNQPSDGRAGVEPSPPPPELPPKSRQPSLI